MRLYKGELADIFKTVFKMQVSKGEFVDKFQKEFARYIGVRHAIATSTGRKGLELILEALGLKKGDEIILPAYTLKDLVFLLQNKGFIPVLVDIEKDTLNIDPKLIEKAITARTKVIIATHMFGAPCDMDKIIHIAEKYNISVVEDCAHAAGAGYNAQRAGSLGKAAFFSLEAIKPINTFGGGMVTTNDPNMAGYIEAEISKLPYNSRRVLFKIFYTYCEHLILHSPLYYFISLLFSSDFFLKIISNTYRSIHEASRANDYRYSNLQSVLGLKQLGSLDKNNLLRKEKAVIFTKYLKSSIAVQRILPNTSSSYYFFIVMTHLDSSKARRYLLKEKIDAGSGSEISDDCIAVTHGTGSVSVKEVYGHALQIPLYDSLSKNNIVYIAEALNKIALVYPHTPV